MDYIIDDIQSADKSEAHKLRIKAAKYCIFIGKIYQDHT